MFIYFNAYGLFCFHHVCLQKHMFLPLYAGTQYQCYCMASSFLAVGCSKMLHNETAASNECEESQYIAIRNDIAYMMECYACNENSTF